MENISTDFGADSSSRFPFRARANRQTGKLTDAVKSHIGLVYICPALQIWSSLGRAIVVLLVLYHGQ